MSAVVRTVKGSLPVSGTRVPRRQEDPIKTGAVYELHGSVNSFVVWALPDEWIESWLGRARTITDPSGTNRFTVLGATMNPDGRFAVQVKANHGSPIVLIVGGVILAMAVMAGITINQVFEIVPEVAKEAGDGIKEGVGGLVLLGGLVFTGAMLWKSQ